MENQTPIPTRVLLVDDDAAILRSLERVLVEHDLAIETACCAAEADIFIDRNQFDAIVCDYNMPGRSGLEFLADVKKKKPELVTFILSGQVSEVNVANDWAKEIGVHAVFAKPFDANMIATEIIAAVSDPCEPAVD